MRWSTLSTTKDKVLNRYHVIFLAQSVMLGTGILSLPQKLSSMGYSQTFMPLLYGLIATLTLFAMVWLCSKFPNDDLFKMNEILLGKYIGKTINFFIIIQCIVFSAEIISNYMHLIQSTALQEQTITLPVLCFLLLLIYIVNGGIKSIARFCIMTFFITIWMFYFTRWAIEKGSVSHLLPLFNFTTKEFYAAFKQGYFSFLGYELIVFYFPFIIDKKKAFRHSLLGVWISVFLCFITTLISVMYYSEWQLKNVEFSVLNLFKAGEFTFIERIDIIGITLWVFLILTSMTAYVWCAKQGAHALFPLPKKKKNYYLYMITCLIFVIIKMPVSREVQDKLFMASNYIGYILIIWPLFLIMIYLFRKKQVQV